MQALNVFSSFRHIILGCFDSTVFFSCFDNVVLRADLAVYRLSVINWLQVPSAHLDGLWRDYERFENSAVGPTRNPQAIKRFIDDMRPRCQAARVAWTHRNLFLDRLDFTALPYMPGRSPNSSEFEQQRDLWLEFLAYEMKNEQGLELKALQARVNLSYQQALYVLRNCPEVPCRAVLPFCPIFRLGHPENQSFLLSEHNIFWEQASQK